MATNYPTLSFGNADLIKGCIKADQPVLLIGSPGVGKTSLMHDLAAEVGLPLVVIIASTCDPTDFGGFPVVRADGAFDRVPMRAIRTASDKPCLLFLDEISTAPPQVQATLLQGVWAREFGDVTLHEGTRIVAAANPADQAPGGYELAAPLIGRFSVYDFDPTIDEVRGYFNKLGAEDSKLREFAIDLAATSQHAPELFQMHPPQAAVTEGAKWASPRDWERGMRSWAEMEGSPIDVVSLILGGAVGETMADAFIGIRKLRVHLPTVQDILKDPEKAKMPAEVDHQIGALGLLANVAQTDVWPAWVYCERLAEEVGAAATRALLAMSRDSTKKSKWRTKGQKALTNMLGKIGAALGS